MVRTVSVLSSIALVSAQDLFLERIETVVDERGAMHSCMKTCLKTDRSKHFKKCEADGSTDCSKSKCCDVITDTCFVKNPYWSSCQPSCKKGHKDKKGETWDCTPLSPAGCSTLQACMAGCQGNLGVSNSTLDDLDLIDDAEPEEDPELAEELEDDPELAEPVSTLTEDSLSLTAEGDPSKCTGGDMEVCKASCKQSFKDNDYIEHVCEVLCDKNCPNAPAKKCPNKNGLGACVSSCKTHSTMNDQGSHCEKDGSTSCLHSKCCKLPGAKCMTKNPYWAACVGECKKGKKNPVDNQVWDCKELKGKQVCDPAKYRKCASDCVKYC
jgi:hypothetical protein